MIAVDPICPPVDEIRRLSVGRLPTGRFESLLRHLDQCRTCQGLMEGEISSLNDPLLAAFGLRTTESDSTAGEPECWAAMQHAAVTPAPNEAGNHSIPATQLGPYRLIRCLGSGGMGAVYLAEHAHLARECAIKLLPRERALDPRWKDRFEREMKVIAAINDPHIVAVNDAGEDQGWHYFVMEYLDGLDLSRLTSRLPPLAVSDACELVRQAAEGLAHIHQAGLVHRDIKPSNLMLTRSGVVKLLDFGLVYSDADALLVNERLTAVGNLIGTLAYMAPEQLLDSRWADSRADLYSLGATLFRLLAGVSPHGTLQAPRGIASLVIHKTEQPAPSLVTYRNDVPVEICELVARLLERDPAQRLPSARELAEALGPWARGAKLEQLISLAMSAPPSGEEEQSLLPVPQAAVQMALTSVPPPRGKRKRLALAAAMPLFLLAGILIVVKTDRGELVIQSEQASLEVVVWQDDEVVESLQLETGDNEVTLRSGSYRVKLGGNAENVVLSEDRITISRGDKAIITAKLNKSSTSEDRSTAELIDRISSVEPGSRVGKPAPIRPFSRAEAAPDYAGKTLAEWLVVMRTEQDPKELAKAISAATELVTSHSHSGFIGGLEEMQMAVAKQILRLARDHRHGDHQERLGHQVLHAIHLHFPKFLLEPGLAGLEEEMSEGNLSSFITCTEILYSSIGQSVIRLPIAPFLQTDHGKQQLNDLRKVIDTAVSERNITLTSSQPWSPGEIDLPDDDDRIGAMVYGVRLRLNNLLGIDSAEDPFISPVMLDSINHAAETHRAIFHNFGTSDSSAAITQNLAKIVHPCLLLEGNPSIDQETLIWAILPSLIAGEGTKAFRPATGTQELTDRWLERMTTAYPVAVSDTLSVFLSKRKWQSLSFLTPTAPLEPAVWRTLFQAYPAHVSKPVAAASDLAILVARKKPGDVRSILTTALEQLRARVRATPLSDSSKRDNVAQP